MFRRVFPWSRNPPEPAEKVLIKGDKVILREKRIGDAQDDYAWRTDEELARLDATRTLNMPYESFLKYSREELAFDNPMSRRFAIDTHDGKHIGNCMYYDIDLRQGEAEVGIMIGDREYWGQGYGTDSVDSLLDHIFTATPLTRVYLHTLEWNHRAQRSFAKAGFRDVKKVLRSGEAFILMEISRPDWERRQPPGQQAGDGHPGESRGRDSGAGPGADDISE